MIIYRITIVQRGEGKLSPTFVFQNQSLFLSPSEKAVVVVIFYYYYRSATVAIFALKLCMISVLFCVLSYIYIYIYSIVKLYSSIIIFSFKSTSFPPFFASVGCKLVTGKDEIISSEIKKNEDTTDIMDELVAMWSLNQLRSSIIKSTFGSQKW